jgi:hypothetical protein
VRALIVAAALTLAPVPGRADTVSNAYALCRVIDGTGFSSAPCSVSGWQQAVTATLDMHASEAWKLCPRLAGLMREKNLRFEAGWKLEIKSPYSGSITIAFCSLPN